MWIKKDNLRTICQNNQNQHSILVLSTVNSQANKAVNTLIHNHYYCYI